MGLQTVPTGYINACLGNVQVAINSATGAILVDGAGMTPTAGSLTLTGSAQQLSATSKPCKGVILYIPAHNVTIGSAVGSQPVTLTASTEYELPVSNVNQLFVNGTNADVLGFIYFN